MYLKKIYLENVGPIEKLEIELPFHEEGENAGKPKPLILVGQNGSGKSTILSFVVNAFFSEKSEKFPCDKEIRKGSNFRVRTSRQIKNKEVPYYSVIEFDNETKITESKTIKEEKILPNKIRKASEIYSRGVFLFFPPNRFEEPLWSRDHVIYTESLLEPMIEWEESNRKIIQTSPLAEIKHWIVNTEFDAFLGKEGSKDIQSYIEKVVQEFLGFSGKVAFIIDYKGTRRLGIQGVENSKKYFCDLFNMSSGEVSLFCMFCAILRDADLAELFDKKTDNSQWKNLGDIEGIVVIDEIDLHLHTKMQSEILPKLIALFPKIQFIITTHSPLFLLGMEEQFTKDGIEIIELKNGKSRRLSASVNYSEFVETANLMKLRWYLENSDLPLVLVEGPTDVKYIERAAILSKKSDLLEKVKLKIVGHIDEKNGRTRNSCDETLKGAKRFLESNLETLGDNKKALIIYDPECNGKGYDTGNFVKGKLVVRKINSSKNDENFPIKRGIEALFSKDFIDKLKIISPDYFKQNTYNILEKKSVCDWICDEKNSSADDFKNFDQIFKMIEEVLNSETDNQTNNNIINP